MFVALYRHDVKMHRRRVLQLNSYTTFESVSLPPLPPTFDPLVHLPPPPPPSFVRHVVACTDDGRGVPVAAADMSSVTPLSPSSPPPSLARLPLSLLSSSTSLLSPVPRRLSSLCTVGVWMLFTFPVSRSTTGFPDGDMARARRDGGVGSSGRK